ncbi:MAG: hypothetical protein GY757_35095, partial [bacterium]|nr:hypothetical protein [bacterium]
RLLTHPEIKEAVVLAHESKDGDKHLCAYYVVENIQHPTSSIQSSSDTQRPTAYRLPPTTPIIRTFLSQFLPDYMLPSYFIKMEKIPLTPNGKIDRKTLTQIQISNIRFRAYMAPRNSIEEKLTGIWANVLERKKAAISIDDNFFDIGGHSLRATIMASKIHKEFNVKLPLAEIFKN